MKPFGGSMVSTTGWRPATMSSANPVAHAADARRPALSAATSANAVKDVQRRRSRPLVSLDARDSEVQFARALS